MHYLDGCLVSMTADRAIDDDLRGIASSRNGSTLYQCLQSCCLKGSQFVDARLGKRSLVVAASGRTTSA